MSQKLAPRIGSSWAASPRLKTGFYGRAQIFTAACFLAIATRMVLALLDYAEGNLLHSSLYFDMHHG